MLVNDLQNDTLHAFMILWSVFRHCEYPNTTISITTSWRNCHVWGRKHLGDMGAYSFVGKLAKCLYFANFLYIIVYRYAKLCDVFLGTTSIFYDI